MVLTLNEAIVKTKKVGGSVMVTIPKELVEQEHIGIDEKIKITVSKIRKDFFGAFPKLKPFNKETDRFHFRHE